MYEFNVAEVAVKHSTRMTKIIQILSVIGIVAGVAVCTVVPITLKFNQLERDLESMTGQLETIIKGGMVYFTFIIMVFKIYIFA